MIWFIIFIVIIFVLAAAAGNGRCDICNLPIKRTYYKWTIAGEKQKLCPKCNSQMERKVSRNSFKNKFG
jgi:transcription initiation factor IIE alpha subunit